MLKLRILTAAIGIPIILAAGYYGGIIFLTLVVAISLVGMVEFFNLLTKMGLKPILSLGWVSSFVLLLLMFAASRGLLEGYKYMPGLFFIMALWAAILVWRDYPKNILPGLAASFFGVFYIAGMLGHLFLLRHITPNGWTFVLFALLLTWASDTGAFFAGTKFGRQKLAPLISPGKTWEGVWGGIILSILTSITLGAWLGLPLMWRVIAGVFVSLAAVIGDLFESALKRYAGMKDSGTLLPGHGGVLDRFDSLLLTAPLVYYMLALFIIG
ncbi:MAG: phosphatidate cytidylyltransferase [Bacillota bacterium]